MDQAVIDEIARNAAAYGWEIGKGKAMDIVIEPSTENPFMNRDWAAEVQPNGDPA